MKNKIFDYFNLIKSLLKEINQHNLETFDFSKKEIFLKIKDKLIYELPYDLHNTFHQYIDLIIEYVLEIRKDDCIKIFASGFAKGIEFERYLKNKHEKNEK